MTLLIISLAMTAITSMYALHLVEIENSKTRQYIQNTDQNHEFEAF